MFATRVPILGIAIAVGFLIAENVGALAYQQAREEAPVRDVDARQRQRDVEELQREIEAKRLHVEELRRQAAELGRTRCGNAD